MTHRVAVFGASGFAGAELVRILDPHPGLELAYLGAHTKAGSLLGDVHPHLPGGERILCPIDANLDNPIDLAFLALPHGASYQVGYDLAQSGVKVVDLGSDYRLDNELRYREAYGLPHPSPEQLSRWRYGLPELFDVSGADLVAAPGCYPTAVLLAIAPLVRAGLVGSTGIIANCLSGVSGAGRMVSEEMMFSSVGEGVRPYAIAAHRHRPEIEMGIDLIAGGRSRVTFTPHLIPIQRGLLATVTAPLLEGTDREELMAILDDTYKERPLVEVIDAPPRTQWVAGSSRALVTAFVDGERGQAVAVCAIDNLGKGAAGQAVQAANLMFGLPEQQGLSLAGWMP